MVNANPNIHMALRAPSERAMSLLIQQNAGALATKRCSMGGPGWVQLISSKASGDC